MTYLKAQNYLNSFINYERLDFYPDKSSFKLARVQRLLELLGNPHQGLLSIHIAGTKGKGSTCAFVANILSEAGFKVGLYTSPHLIDVRERIRILQRAEKEIISKKYFAKLVEKIKPFAEKLRKTKLGELSYYEFLTTMAFLYFKEAETDFVVLETGVGGRLDATNVADPFICAITPISYEHTQVLGTTLKEIAEEKSGIIKRKTKNEKRKTNEVKIDRQIVVSAPQRPVVRKLIRRRAKKYGADLIEVGKDIQINPRLKIGLLGRHQLVNVAVAVGCVNCLRSYGVKVNERAIKRGLKTTHWPGRLQIISQNPRVVLDGAQNQASACALKDALSQLFKFRNLILVVGVSQDKDVRGILKELVPCASRIILTKTQTPRAMEPQRIKTFVKTNSKPIILTENVGQALKVARQNATQRDLILVTGSLFLVGEVLALTLKCTNTNEKIF